MRFHSDNIKDEKASYRNFTSNAGAVPKTQVIRSFFGK
jgi:hypothetical protein